MPTLRTYQPTIRTQVFMLNPIWGLLYGQKESNLQLRGQFRWYRDYTTGFTTQEPWSNSQQGKEGFLLSENFDVNVTLHRQFGVAVTPTRHYT